MEDIFISYRRRDSALFVEVLANHLGKILDVFLDVGNLELGAPFMSRIQHAIATSRLVIVVIGPGWDSSRLHDVEDVVAYELRTARRFARRVIPLVLQPAALPDSDSLPADLNWLTELNAFMMPEAPGHRAHLVQLTELVRGVLEIAREAPAPVFSVPTDSHMLRLGEGNIPFTETFVPDSMRCCSVSGSSGMTWLASYDQLEVRNATNGVLLNTAREGSEWLHATSSGAFSAKSSVGYQAPDTIRFAQFDVRDGTISATEVGFTWSWQTPPLALSHDGATLLAYVDTPHRKDVLAFSVKDKREISACAFPDGDVVSICFNPAAEGYVALSVKNGTLVLQGIDPSTCTTPWSRELPTEGKLRIDSLGIANWRDRGTLLVNTGNALLEVEPSSGEIRRTLMSSENKLECLAVDPSTSLACIAEGSSLRMWLPNVSTFLEVDLDGDRCRACSLNGGYMAALVGTDARCRLLSAFNLSFLTMAMASRSE